MEREASSQLFDPAVMGETLECPPQQRGPEVVSFNLANEALGVSVRLDLIEPRRAVSLYIRGQHAFLGFVHMEAVEQVSIDRHKGEVKFSFDRTSSQLSVQRGGVFLVSRKTD